MKRLAILGSTGSIGRQTLEVIAAFPDRFQVLALAAGRNIELLERQIVQFKPKLVFSEIPLNFPNISSATMEEIASHPEVDMVVVATPGSIGLKPTLAAIQAGKRIALANKEVLVMAGEIISREAKKSGAEILPIDSEHSALWQCLRGEKKESISRLIITASGGPFWGLSQVELGKVTPEQALAHPIWRMGKKVTIDSATLLNKGLEVIEAHFLFDFSYQQIEVIIHPQGIVHSLVEFIDGTLKCQLSRPDMRLPIQYALSYPERWPGIGLKRLSLIETGKLVFEPPDMGRFPCLKLAIEAGQAGRTYPAVLSAADEVAVELFLKGKISFTEIPKIIEQALEHHQPINHPSLQDIMEIEKQVKLFLSRKFG